MNRSGKFVAVLVMWGLIAAPLQRVFAHTACVPDAIKRVPQCHETVSQPSGSPCHLQSTHDFCCHLAPILPAKTASYTLLKPAAISMSFDFIPAGALPTYVTNFEDHPRSSARCRSQALLCV